ncbi:MULTISPECIES: TetR/AcrR family transcriptional regulator [Aminobacter]|uniref:AcrR family transcriptional regulator n=1 Tax=Aminobacter niigataensis TaxID=83265 RepID=A0ABR6L4P7_9HYPH|nr:MULTISPECIES: TetR/AcrR family transcriptional regulator [Aminobacter]AWC21696.1 transcriptional regulator BetI [Aminobacter sp. MSH1]MBB4651747.1 AcrR family transcriptional regulator [Aminobacter niigataensis]CAI2932415.1 Transcriptional regulator BetI [Aminobacter niigataensis]
MARPRVIEQSDILDAAELVVVRDGAAHLTLDAVATEAGISKASVVYDYKSKQQLINAVIRRRVENEEQRVQAATVELGPVPSPAINGLVAAAAERPRDHARAVAVNLVSALAQDAESRGIIEAVYARMIASVTETADNPRGAILALLALEGLKRLEMHNLHPWSDAERADILRDIGWLIDAEHLRSKGPRAPSGD